MTINYDTTDHLGVMFRMHGSVFPQVLPWCAWNALMACLVWYLRSATIVNATFDGGLGYQYISVLVSFFVVTNVNTSYSRFWEARGFLGKAIFSVDKLFLRVAMYSGRENHEKAKAWRKIIGVRLSRLFRFAMFMIQKDRAAVVNKEGGKYSKAEGGGLTLNESRKLLSREALKEDVPYDVDVARLCFAVDAAIRSHADFLDNPLHINEQMDLLGKVHSFLDAYDGLVKNATTPRPFPAVQMGRTLLIVWILSLPFALGGNFDDDVLGLCELVFLVFLVTYGFIGLMMAEIEMHDPYGDDANDLEVVKYMDNTLEDIDAFLSEKADFKYAFDFQPDIEKESTNSLPPKGYGAVV